MGEHVGLTYGFARRAATDTASGALARSKVSYTADQPQGIACLRRRRFGLRCRILLHQIVPREQTWLI